MLILQAFFLWLIVSMLMLGGAMIFHRSYPEESPWFGFIIPPLTLVLTFNFIEHLIALPTLLFLLPLLLGATVWMMVSGTYFKQALILPTFVFLLAFAFTFWIRCLRPDIDYTSDGISDLNMINNFLQGSTLPPPDTWMPPHTFEWYYYLQHYAASVVARLLAVKVGVAYNVCHALLSALICVTGAAAAHRISGGKIWITLAVPFLIEASATGSSAYLYLTSKSGDLWMATDLSYSTTHPPDSNPIWKWLFNDFPAELKQLPPEQILQHQTLRLQVPGFWTWRSEYHANASGHWLSVLAVLVLAELAYTRKTIWPWVLAGMIPFIAAVGSAWALPITALCCWLIIPIALLAGRQPASIRLTVLTFFGALILIWPAFYNVTSSPQVPQVDWTNPLERVPLVEFLIQWWPILLLWICGILSYRRLSFDLRWILLIIPVMLIGIELITIDTRYNTVEKMWGYTWAVGLVGIFPFVASRAAVFFRIVTILLLCSALVSLIFFVRDATNGTWDNSAFHLEGNQRLRFDEQKRRLLEVMSETKHSIYLSGKCEWCFNESPTPAVFTGNKSYIAWSWFESLTDFASEANYRNKLNNDFYSGAMTDRLHFLLANKISGVVIWPDDNLSDDFLDNLRKELAPTYDYIDCKGSGEKNAGVFLQNL